MPTPSRSRVLAIAVVCHLIHFVAYGTYTADDTCISDRVAANRAFDLGPVFNPDERVEG